MSTEFEKEIGKLDKNVKIILIFGAIALIVMPIVATQFDLLLDFTEKGKIGDTLSGTTTPVIGIVSALLIYFSFRAQIKANEIIQKQINKQEIDQKEKKEFEFQMERYKYLKELIDEFKFTVIESRISENRTQNENNYIQGVNGIEFFFKKFKEKSVYGYSSEVSQVKSIVSILNLLINHLKPIKENANQQFIFNLIEIQFYRRIWDQNSGIIDSCIKSQSSYSKEIIDLSKKMNDIHIELVKYKNIWN